MVVEIFSTMFLTPFLIRTLGNAEYGIYQLIISINMSFTLLDLGVGNSVIRYMSKYRVEKNGLLQRKFLGVTTFYYFVMAALALIIGAVVRYYLPSFFKVGLTAEEIQLARKLFSVTIITSAVSLATSGFANTVIAYERFDISKGTSIVLTIAKLIISFTVLKLGFSSLGVVLVNLGITVAMRLVYTCFVLFRLKIIPLFKELDFGFIKDIVAYSSFIMLQLFATFINAHTDQVLLAAFAANSAGIIAVYGVGAQVLQYFKTIGTHFTGVLMPGLVRLVKSGAGSEEYQREMVKVGRIIFMVLSIVWVTFAVNGSDFILLWTEPDYKDAFYVALILMFPVIFTYVESAGNQLLQAMKKHKKPAMVQVVSAVLNIVLTIFLIKWKPLEGAVIGSFIALFVCELIVMNIMYKKLLDIKLLKYFLALFRGIVPCLAAAAVSGVLFRMLGLIKYGWLGFGVNCAVMVAVYGATMVLFGMNAYEKELAFKPIRKIYKKFSKKGDINVQG